EYAPVAPFDCFPSKSEIGIDSDVAHPIKVDREGKTKF
ncbi:hypothetical protein IFM89_005284, partial [Coptis chinensis]